jgi:hypothetical protein
MVRSVLVMTVALVGSSLLWTGSSPTNRVLGMAVVGGGAGGGSGRSAKSLGRLDNASNNHNYPTTTTTTTSRPFVELWSEFAPLAAEYQSASATTTTTTTTTITDRLPANYVAEWPTFVLELSSLTATTATATTTNESTTNNNNEATTSRWTWSRIPDASCDDDDRAAMEDTVLETTMSSSSSSPFVNPVTLDTLWHAVDLQPPIMDAAIGLHVRNGRVRHVLPALDLFYGVDDDDDDSTNQDNGEELLLLPSRRRRRRRMHRNRGLNSVPRAHAWLDFGAYLQASSSSCNIACRLETRSIPSSKHDENDWTTQQVLPRVSEMIQLALEVLATDAPASLGQGSAIVHIVLVTNQADAATTTTTTTTNPSCPIRTHSQVRVVLEQGAARHDDGDDAGNDDDGDTNTTTNQDSQSTTKMMVGGLLHVTLASTAAGSESEYLPDCYAPLYTNLAHRRLAFSQQ